ncbi:hypothetical protein INR49_001023 [Caranx melampygus]|nr:hypothetical protein INR49_001023 [Caranx melampygus]
MVGRPAWSSGLKKNHVIHNHPPRSFTSSHLSTSASSGMGGLFSPFLTMFTLSCPTLMAPHLSQEAPPGHLCCSKERTPSVGRHSQRAPSVAESMAEYFDASRRTTLPAPGTDNSHIGIMTILYNNIGKDLSRVSMPVALNEPVSLLQRLSEELEYSDLLDIANHIDDPFERMVYVAAFSISGYAWASWRYRYKPFNPVLGETYESQREDRGFCYISEQVSHHPPISACYAESENFTFWQDVQPDDHFQFYGFSHYARELNELTPDLKEVLPPTDTRFRPDQRLLEEGKVTEADKER